MTIEKLLSKRGQTINFSNQDILFQGGEAKGKKINATFGIALEDDQEPIYLSAMSKNINFDPKTFIPYAPCSGKERLRKCWKELLLEKNPSLTSENISLPVVTTALTHALSVAAYLFLDPGEAIIIPSPYWSNYDLIFKQKFQIEIERCELFDQKRELNLVQLKKLLSTPGKKKSLLLNFPHNPTGYTPVRSEMREMIEIIKEAANRQKIIVICDDAYFGFFYEQGIDSESIFSKLVNLHENILAIKVDGMTKEYYAWGLRIGFLTYGMKNGSKEFYKTLMNKTAGAVRATVSNTSHISQTLALQALQSSSTKIELIEKYNILKRRYQKAHLILDEKKEKYSNCFTPLPFNSGYFLCLKLKKADPERVRNLLLKKYDTGVVALNGLLRVSFSSVSEKLLNNLFDNIYNACLEIDRHQ